MYMCIHISVIIYKCIYIYIYTYIERERERERERLVDCRLLRSAGPEAPCWTR